MFISFAFMSNIRATLLKPSYETPVDSTEELLKRGITPINSNGGFWEEYLLSSINPWERLAGEKGITFESGSQQQRLIREKVKMEGSHASLENTEAIAYLSLVDPQYKSLPAPVFHLSKEHIRPHYHGWVLRKGSAWKELIDQHILLCAQVLY